VEVPLGHLRVRAEVNVEEGFNTQGVRSVNMNALDRLSDGELVQRAREGDEYAYGALVERYMRSAYLVALSVTRRHEDAEDASQESFMVALERLDECRSPEKFGGWFMTIVRNRSRNLLRRESLRSAEPVPDSARADGPTPLASTERSELRGVLGKALGALNELQREIVLLHDMEGWKHREIAERLGIPSGTVRSHLHFARKSLRGSLSAVKDMETDE
jgi:RNA polymerase sigma-70 factor (ECF subfamily)